MSFRTDRNNNPTAMTTAVAAEGGLQLGVDYESGDSFTVGNKTYYTARLLGNPISLTQQVLNKIGFYTTEGIQRWTYIGIPFFIWESLNDTQKKEVINFMYHHEGGTELSNLFATPINISIDDSITFGDKLG